MKFFCFIGAWIAAEMAHEYYEKENVPCCILFSCLTVWMALNLFFGG